MAIFYLDESGDLGWSFDAPYRAGGSSRYLTIAALETPSELKKYPKRVIRKLYNQFRWPTHKERKWAEMKAHERNRFCERARNLNDQHPSIRMHSITVYKPNVAPHIRQDSNKLYNYMIRLMLAEAMARHEYVDFIPDPRSIKVESGNSLHDYLQTTLWFELGVQTKLQTSPQDSENSKGVQFADMLAGAVQQSYEDNNSDCYRLIEPRMNSRTLFFS